MNKLKSVFALRNLSEASKLAQDKTIDHAQINKEPEKIFPPFTVASTRLIVATILIADIHAIHVVVVYLNNRGFLPLLLWENILSTLLLGGNFLGWLRVS